MPKISKIFLLITFVVFGFFIFGEAKAGSTDNVSGWAWSENIGWINFNGSNYGVNINPSTGVFSGYAWSENIGWIDFGPISGFPEAPNYGAKMDLTTGKVTGWAKAVAGGTTGSGGWDGWIKMSDGTYGLNVDLTNGDFHGGAWSDMVIGWLSFNSTDPGAGGAAYKVVLDLSTFNQPPTAINLSVDDPNAADYCGITGYPPVRVRWQFSDSDSGDSQSAYQIQVDDNSDFSSLLVDTDKISNSSQSFLIGPPYPTLSWNATYYWRLKVWDSKDNPSGWVVYQNNISPPESFTTTHAWPYIDFSWNPPSPVVDELTQFTDESEVYGGATKSSWFWEFPADWLYSTSSNSSSQNPKGKFTTSGQKTVYLTVTDSDNFSCRDKNSIPLGVLLPLPEWREVPPL